MEELHQGDGRLLALVDAATGRAAETAGGHLPCHAGCTPCCHGPFSITQLDAWRLRRGLGEIAVTDPDRALAIRRRASDVARAQASFFPDGRAGLLDSEREERAHFIAFADTPCPALDPDTGACQVYAWRPVACRLHGPPLRLSGDDLSPCSLCFTEATAEEIEAARLVLDVAPIEAPLDASAARMSGRTSRTTVTFALAGTSGAAQSGRSGGHT